MNLQLLDYLASDDSVWGGGDVTHLAPGMDYDEAYRAQFAAKQRQQVAHGPVIGYQASLTSQAAQRLGPPDMPKPYVGTLLLRNWREAGAQFAPGLDYLIECEIGVRMAARLQGPGITAEAARLAVGSVHAAIEVVPLPPQIMQRTGQHLIAIHNFGSWCVFGEKAGAPVADLREVPIELRFDGQPAAAGKAGDSGGDPFAVLAAVANTLGRFGLALEPGMVVMTGATASPTRVPAETEEVTATFGPLGSVSVKFGNADTSAEKKETA